MNRSRRTRAWRRAAPHPPSRALSESSDERLVELVVDGDGAAFELLYRRHVADALAFATGLLGSVEDAEEAVRHSFAAAHAYLAEIGRETAFEPWLYAILENHCLSMLTQWAPGSGESEEEGTTVVDLDQWRRRRNPLGVALPIAPSAGFHESVMTACGFGGGAATAAAPPLLGGALAKVAVVALLAGGGGAAGGAVSDRGGPVDGDVAEAVPVRTGEGGRQAGGRTLQPARTGQRSERSAPSSPARPTAPGMAETDEPSQAAGERAPRPAPGAPSAQPAKGLPTQLGGAAPPPASAPAPAGLPDVDVPALPTAEALVLPGVEGPEVQVPDLGDAETELPNIVDAPKVLDDEAVSHAKPLIDRALARRAAPAR